MCVYSHPVSWLIALLCLLCLPIRTLQGQQTHRDSRHDSNAEARLFPANDAPSHIDSSRGRPSAATVLFKKVLGVNLSARDNSPVVSTDGNLIFFNSTRSANREWARFDSASGRYDEDIFYAVRLSEGLEEKWSEPVNLGPAVNSGADDGIVSLSPDGRTVYFNSLKRKWTQNGGPFYRATLSGIRWSNIQGLGGGLTEFFIGPDSCLPFRIYGASMSPDQRSFYFATTYHSTDCSHQIWVSRFVEGKWSYPERLGGTVNFGGETFAPYVGADGVSLLFASRRANGIGGDDIYATVLRDGKWQKPVLLPAGLNSRGDESFFALTAGGDRAYLSSSQSGPNSDDIYTIPIEDVLPGNYMQLVHGTVVDSRTGTPLSAAITVEAESSGPLQSRTGIYNGRSNQIAGTYGMVLASGRSYRIRYEAPGYLPAYRRCELLMDSSHHSVVQDVELTRPGAIGLSGMVSGVDGRPAPDSWVEVAEAGPSGPKQSQPLRWGVRAEGARGCYSVPLNPGRGYDLMVGAPGYMPVRQHLDIDEFPSSIEIERNFRLQRIDRLVLRGVVRDNAKRSKTIPARLTVNDAASDSLVAEVSAGDTTGAFVVQMRPGRSYRLSISAPGYRGATRYYTAPEKPSKRELSSDFLIDPIPPLTPSRLMPAIIGGVLSGARPSRTELALGLADARSGRPIAGRLTIRVADNDSVVAVAPEGTRPGRFVAIAPANRGLRVLASAPGYIAQEFIQQVSPSPGHTQIVPLERVPDSTHPSEARPTIARGRRSLRQTAPVALAVPALKRVAIEPVATEPIAIERTAGMFADGFDTKQFGQDQSYVLYIFPFGNATLKPPFSPLLDSLVSVMRRYPRLRIEVSGHTDTVGSTIRNRRTSARRAESVRDFLLRAGGIRSDRVRVVAEGADRPFASNATDAGRALNRRVEFKVLPDPLPRR
jgi:outer membrane protein OmpA-like peptidoglycan-associated protein